MIGGELVREARRRAGLTQRELAERAGTTQSAIARLESGRTSPSFEQVERLLKLCGFSMIVSLATYDDSHLVQAKAKLRRSVEQRVRDNKNAVKQAIEWQEAFERGRPA
jgi:transcriptional regulator with XRE-family HTH domain